jgi:MFS family permease
MNRHPDAADDATLAYLEQLGISLSLREIPEGTVEDLVDEVAGHLEDSGEDPHAAFGPANDLAARLAHARGHQPSMTGTVTATLSGLGVVAGFIFAMAGGMGAVQGTAAEVTVGALVSVAIVTTFVPVATPIIIRSLDGRTRRSLVGAAGLGGAVAALVGATLLAHLLLPMALFTLPAVVALSVGAALVLAGAWSLRRSRDPLRRPGEPGRRWVGRRDVAQPG